MWNIFGISGKLDQLQNSFENPFDNRKKVFVFSDVPHLLKTIRNRLYTKKTFQVRNIIYHTYTHTFYIIK